ncbi:MAG: hypothetical protein JXR76_14700 [Deltaproteobacteria bacterium]|nr:hypothetical protein [Deltaproteobacteria bacterium]
MRGRLIFKFLAEIYRLDTLSTAATDPDGSGPLTGGYDPDFKESVLVDTNNDGIGERVRREHPPVRVPCQVDTKAFEELRMLGSGNSPKSRIDLIFHFMDLERLGLMDAVSGDALLRPGDRLGGIYDLYGDKVQDIQTPPGLYVVESRPIGFGLNLSKPSRNLLLVTFEDRPTGSRRHA